MSGSDSGRNVNGSSDGSTTEGASDNESGKYSNLKDSKSVGAGKKVYIITKEENNTTEYGEEWRCN